MKFSRPTYPIEASAVSWRKGNDPHADRPSGLEPRAHYFPDSACAQNGVLGFVLGFPFDLVARFFGLFARFLRRLFGRFFGVFGGLVDLGAGLLRWTGLFGGPFAAT